MPSLNTILSWSSAFVLLVISSVFGFMGVPTEMGLSILAGALGLAFANIENIAEFSGAGFSAKMKCQIQAVVEKETEPEDISLTEEDKIIEESEKSVIKALNNPKYTWRTLSGISKEASMPENEVWKALVSLIQKELVRTGNKNKTGEMIWALTRQGRAYAGKIA